MTWFEDDSKGIPEYIKNMPKEQLEAEIRELEEELIYKKQMSKHSKAQSVKTPHNRITINTP
jgi:ribosomal protein L29